MPVNFEDVLLAMDADTRAAYEAHTAALKSALQKERQAAETAQSRVTALEADLGSKTSALASIGVEKEQLASKVVELNSQLETSANAARKKTVEDEIVKAATLMQFENPFDATRFVSVESFELNDKGEPVGVKEALEAVVAKSPYLVRKAVGTPPGPPPDGDTQIRVTVPIPAF